MRLQAVDHAVKAAVAARLEPRPADVQRARDVIARNHGFRSWRRLSRSLDRRRYFAYIADAESRLARATRMRETWFGPSRIDPSHFKMFEFLRWRR